MDIPKCGCTSVFAAVGSAPAGNWHAREIPDELADLPRFAIVRNPYCRAASLFYFERYQCSIGNKSWYPGGAAAFFSDWQLHAFEAFLERLIENSATVGEDSPARHFPNFLPCALFLDPVQPLAAVLKLERLQLDWDAIDWLPRVRIPHERRGEYLHAFTPLEAALVEEWAAADFRQFGYVRPAE